MCLSILSKKNDNVFKHIYDNIDYIKVKLSIGTIQNNIVEIIEKAKEMANRKKAGLKFAIQHVNDANDKIEKFVDFDIVNLAKR